MEGKRYAISRKKACQHCSSVKAKCDLKDSGCSRCARRKLLCVYPRASASRRPTRGMSSSSQAEPNNPIFPSSGRQPDNTQSSIVEPLFPPSGREPDDNTQDSIVSMHAMGDNRTNNAPLPTLNGSYDSTLDATSQPQALDFSELELICPINANDISNRWLNNYVPLPGQKPKDYPASITAFVYRIFKSYAAVTVHGRELPPLVHFSQVSLPSATTTSLPLSTCLSLVRICEKLRPGSEHVAVDILQREMNNIFEQRGTYDDMALLAAFQAYMIYCLVLFFNLDRGSDPFLRQAMMNLQELACSSSHRGLVCTAEEQHARPKWEAWIVAEAKRRTLYAMYLFDSILSSQDGLPTFLGTELYGLPAPTSKHLWRAQTRGEWERAYNLYLAGWVNGGLYIHELWPIPADMDESGVLERRRRVDQWLGDVDEYGTMMYAVTSCTHGG